ncbi:TonB-dependent receptor [Acidovorax sp. Leaf76]|uniref:TonB-dependent receptor domain-containing protein n=1 Tax=unclassified Acidovorax TaxID=2684926 RepID=UPI0006F5E59E|nr:MULTISPECIES: TonB-dependent receptor [unclassified Acidovorax]KQO15271.1 TonB-dependent receptor [Acidovorax sp. Leaf76]KQO32087.1 TonB-dependent receptor [Acidovorax sp. Leaf84]KQS29584.1 TonB-dependent receptor [Acidovorax sp. Leaf191]
MKIRTPRARIAAPLCLQPALAAMAVVAACSAQAQVQPAPNSEAGSPVQIAQNLRAPSLTETVVTATRTPQPLSDLVADVTVIDRDTIETSGATGLADVLARVPGIEFSRNGGPGTTTGVFLRGAESRFTAVYIDGVRIDSQSTGGAAWEAIPLAQIDRIEVLRGPAGAVYGSDAMGGVIQIFTKRGENGVAPYVGIGVGSHSTTKIEAGVSGATGTIDYALGIAREKSKGFNARTVATQNPDRDGYESTSANARLGLQINAAHRLDATLLANDLDSGYDNGLGKDDRNQHQLHALGLTWQAQWTTAYKTRLQVTDSRDQYETTPSVYLSETHLRGYLFQNEWRQDAHLVTAALERREDNLQNAPIDRSRSQDAIALGYGYTAGGHTLQANVRHDSDSEFGGKGTGSLAYGYTFAPQWRATASVGTAFRAPTLYQRFSEYGVGSLKPESSRNAEVGLRWAQGSNSFSATVYRNRVQDLISFGAPGPCPSPFGCYVNTARAEYKGVTFAGSYRLAGVLGGVQLRGSLDLQDPRDLDTGKQLARRAKRHGTLGADTQLAGWTVGAEVQASGRRFDTVANTNVLGGYTLVNLYASTRIARDFTLVARVDNVGDKHYELARTYATAGRTAYVGVKWAPQ